jgi:hypothetical protein
MSIVCASYATGLSRVSSWRFHHDLVHDLRDRLHDYLYQAGILAVAQKLSNCDSSTYDT